MSVADVHQKGYRSTSEEVWKQNPVCTEDNHAWPCDVAAYRAEVVAALAENYAPRYRTEAPQVVMGYQNAIADLAETLGIDLNAELTREETS